MLILMEQYKQSREDIFLAFGAYWTKHYWKLLFHSISISTPPLPNFNMSDFHCFLSKHYQKSKWVWSGNTTIWRPTHGTLRKSHRTLTVTIKDIRLTIKASNQLSRKLEGHRVLNNKTGNKHRTPTKMGATINKTFQGEN